MQIQSLRIRSYRSWCVDDKAGPVAIEQLNKLELYRDLKAKDCDEVLRLKAIGCSRATCFRSQR